MADRVEATAEFVRSVTHIIFEKLGPGSKLDEETVQVIGKVAVAASFVALMKDGAEKVAASALVHELAQAALRLAETNAELRAHVPTPENRKTASGKPII